MIYKLTSATTSIIQRLVFGLMYSVNGCIIVLYILNLKRLFTLTPYQEGLFYIFILLIFIPLILVLRWFIQRDVFKLMYITINLIVNFLFLGQWLDEPRGYAITILFVLSLITFIIECVIFKIKNVKKNLILMTVVRISVVAIIFMYQVLWLASLVH